MKSVRVLSHTADVRLQIKANSRHELFKAGILGLAQIISPRKKERNYQLRRKIQVSSNDFTTLFIDLLNEILTHIHIDKCIYDHIKTLNIKDDHTVMVELEGYLISRFTRDVKAVTYHEAEIIQSAAGIYQTIIILDI